MLFGAAGGGLLALAFLRTRVALGAVAGVIAIVAFCVLAAAGLPILGRYLLAPATILAIFCGAGAFGWAELPRGHPWRRRWAWFGALTLVGLVVFIPAQVDRIGNLRDALRIQDGIQDDLHALTPRFPVHAGHGAQPPPGAAAGAVARRRAPQRSRSPRSSRPRSGTYVVPTSRAWRASTSSIRATSTRASRRPRRASGPSGPTRRGAPSRSADKRTVHPPSKQLYERLRFERLRHRAFPLRTPGSA